MRALEAAKALGSSESADDILQAVAEKVETKQRQQTNKASSTVRNVLMFNAPTCMLLLGSIIIIIH